jgi:predicted dehydrogenase
MTLRIGVIGAAYASATHLPAYAELAAEGIAEVVAVATARRQTAEETARRFAIPAVHVGFEALCTNPDIDLVDVVTRPSRHRVMASSALAAGKHVLVEVPLAATTAEGEALAEAAMKAGRLGVVDMQSRYWPGIVQLRRLVADGFLGQVQNITATAFYPTFTLPAAVASSGWCADAGEGASSLRVHGLHTADLIRWVFGDLTDVRGVTAVRASSWPGPDGPLPASSADSAAYVARIANGPGSGAVCSVHTSWVARFGAGWRLTAHGSEGILVASADGHTGHYPVRLEGARADAPGLQPLLVPGPGLSSSYPFTQLIRELAAELAGGGDASAAPGVPTFADGVAALRIADAAEASLTDHPRAR